MPIKVQQGPNQRQVSNIYVKHGGFIREINEGWILKAGVPYLWFGGGTRPAEPYKVDEYDALNMPVDAYDNKNLTVDQYDEAGKQYLP